MENDKSTQYFLVYKHTSPSGKSYVGLTNNLIEEANDWEKFFIKIENTGRKMTEENKAKLIAISTGRKMSEESRAKM